MLIIPETKVFIIDDDSAVRDSLKLMLEQENFSVETFESAEEFLQRIPDSYYGCAIVDVHMLGMDGMQLQDELINRGIQLPIIFLTAHGDIPMSVRAIKGGAVDFLTKPVKREKLMVSVQAAIEAGEHILAEAVRRQQAQSLLGGLTEREYEVMELAILGYPNKEIARRLDISHRTVEIHKARVMQKTGVSSLLNLARLAHDGGLKPTQEEQSILSMQYERRKSLPDADKSGTAT